MDQELQNLGGEIKQKINHQEVPIGKTIMAIEDPIDHINHHIINPGHINHRKMGHIIIRVIMEGTPDMGNKNTINNQIGQDQESTKKTIGMIQETTTSISKEMKQPTSIRIVRGEIQGAISRI